MWPGISPHNSDVPTSVWNLPFGVWLGYVSAVDQYEAEMKKQKG